MTANDIIHHPRIVLRSLLAGFEQAIAQADAEIERGGDPVLVSWARIRRDLHRQWAADTRAALGEEGRP